MTAATGRPLTAPLPWVGAIILAATVQWAISTALIGAAATLASPGERFRDLVLASQTLRSEAAEMSLAALVTAAATLTPFTIALAFPLVTVMQRAIRHEQLASEARLDHKTGLLNAGAFEREAITEIARAVRTSQPLALAMIDLDHFKQVNDRYGHLAGDKALRCVADTLKDLVREYDLVGRWGGEEFVVLLPESKPVDAYTIAERIRARIAALPIDVGPTPGHQPVTVTVSVGVAALGETWDTQAGSQLADFLAAADMAVYQSKKNGRDQVCVITENATFGTHEQRAFTPPPAGKVRSA
jgi:diguanylate cyclase (GGDEF)-like protein